MNDVFEGEKGLAQAGWELFRQECEEIMRALLKVCGGPGSDGKKSFKSSRQAGSCGFYYINVREW